MTDIFTVHLELEELKRAAEILGNLPSPSQGDATQQPAYRAYKILCDEIDRLESAGVLTPRCCWCGDIAVHGEKVCSKHESDLVGKRYP